MMGLRLTRGLAREIMMGPGLSIIISPHRLIIQVVKVQDLATQYADRMKSLSQGIGPFGCNEIEQLLKCLQAESDPHAEIIGGKYTLLGLQVTAQ